MISFNYCIWGDEFNMWYSKEWVYTPISAKNMYDLKFQRGKACGWPPPPPPSKSARGIGFHCNIAYKIFLRDLPDSEWEVYSVCTRFAGVGNMLILERSEVNWDRYPSQFGRPGIELPEGDIGTPSINTSTHPLSLYTVYR